VRGDACAKLILVGEHAVVYGVPAIAVPVREMRTHVEMSAAAEPANGGPSPGHATIFIADERASDTDLAERMARRALDLAGPGAAAATGGGRHGTRIAIRSEIPLGSGLGSSAALAVALVRAAAAAAAATGAAGGAVASSLALEEVAARALELDKLAHGTPSGIDTTTIAHERAIRFLRGKPPEPLALARPLPLAVGILPRPEGTTTATLVAGVRRLATEEPDHFRHVLLSIGSIAVSARDALEAGDLRSLGRRVNENQRALQELGVSTETADRLCARVRHAGALGAKLSGAGGGGALLAVLPNEDAAPAVVTCLIESGCEDAFLTVVD
jgi:mevalonate kinase